MIKYEKDPIKLKSLANTAVEEQIELDNLQEIHQKLAKAMINACGDLSIFEDLRFSDNFFEAASEAIEDNCDILCDSDAAACGIKRKYLNDDPICLINKASVISQAKSGKHTRSMEAVDLWKPYLSESIVVIGQEPTALFRLLELLKENDGEDIKKPTLVIATPVGFTGAEEAKEYLWKNHQKLEISCITLLGSKGGSDIATAALNTLLKINQELPKDTD